MSISRALPRVLSEHVTLELEGIDRMYLNVYVPALQARRGVAGFFRFHLGHRFASSVLMDPISKAFIVKMGQFASNRNSHRDVWKGERKDDVAAGYRKKFSSEAKGCCSSVRRRRRRRYFAPSAGAMPRPGLPTPGWCAPLRWSISSTCTRGPGLRPVLPEVLQLLPLQREALHQRP